MIALILNVLIFISSGQACDFKSQEKSFYSLSAPVTDVFQRLGLLKKSSLKAVSIFHPIRESDFSGQILPGGVFLSSEKLQQLRGGIVFYDESFDLKKMFKLHPTITAVEIKTRGLTPLEVILEVENKLSPFLKNCHWSQIKEEMRARLNKLSNLMKMRPYLLFFLGHPQGLKWPGTLMLNDGVVKWMLDNKMIQSFPSTLSYVQWSSKMMGQVPKDHLKLGLKDSGRSFEIKIEKVAEGYQLTYPGALSPGFGQVDSLLYFFERIKI